MYKEFKYLNKQDKRAWQDFILTGSVFIEYLANIYEFIGSEDCANTWLLSDINNGDCIKVKPITIFNNDKFQFIKGIN